MRIGVLGLQGDFREHVEMLRLLGVDTLVVKLPEDLELIDGLIIPGGESTTMGRIMETVGIKDPLIERIKSGMPVYGTCAGMILLSKRVEGYNQPLLGVLDVDIQRNAYGRQIESFEVDIDVSILDGNPFRAVFIRAPKIIRLGEDVETLAEYQGDPVLVKQGNILASSFHPELTRDTRIHEYFIRMVER
jgi:5'-phosphate synthase pdxT subunit